MTHVYTAADKELTIEDYPMGGSKRGVARYYVTTGEKGQAKGKQRVERVTTCNGRTGKPKKLTYGRKAVILTGDDGRTYPAVMSEYSDAIAIYQSGMQYQHENVSRSEQPERYAEIEALFDSAE